MRLVQKSPGSVAESKKTLNFLKLKLHFFSTLSRFSTRLLNVCCIGSLLLVFVQWESLSAMIKVRITKNDAGGCKAHTN